MPETNIEQALRLLMSKMNADTYRAHKRLLDELEWQIHVESMATQAPEARHG